MTDIISEKTGTLKPPRKPKHVYSMADFVRIHDKAEYLCRDKQMDVVVYHDERDTISMRSVLNANLMRLPPFVLKTYRYAEVKLTERKKTYGRKSKSKKDR